MAFSRAFFLRGLLRLGGRRRRRRRLRRLEQIERFLEIETLVEEIRRFLGRLRCGSVAPIRLGRGRRGSGSGRRRNGGTPRRCNRLGSIGRGEGTKPRSLASESQLVNAGADALGAARGGFGVGSGCETSGGRLGFTASCSGSFTPKLDANESQ